MEILVHFNDVPVTLVTNGFEDTVDIDKLTSIEYSNLYGEAVTVSALLNKVGLLRAEAEKKVAECKLEKEVYEAQTKKEWRREAESLRWLWKTGKLRKSSCRKRLLTRLSYLMKTIRISVLRILTLRRISVFLTHFSGRFRTSLRN